jgi:hypothetical protein
VNNYILDNGYLGSTPTKETYQYMIIDEKICRIYRVTAHTFEVGDVEDPLLYAADPLIEWQNSEKGQWIMKHAIETPEWHRYNDAMSWGHKFYITAKLKEKDYSFYLLKWGK